VEGSVKGFEYRLQAELGQLLTPPEGGTPNDAIQFVACWLTASTRDNKGRVTNPNACGFSPMIAL